MANPLYHSELTIPNNTYDQPSVPQWANNTYDHPSMPQWANNTYNNPIYATVS